MLSKGEHGALEPIAIVGLAFKFPGGANTEDDFWDMMVERKCVSKKFPEDRGNIDVCHDSTIKGASKVRSNRK